MTPAWDNTLGVPEDHVMVDPSLPLAGNVRLDLNKVILPGRTNPEASVLTLSLSDKYGITLAVSSLVVLIPFLDKVAVSVTNTGFEFAGGLVTAPLLDIAPVLDDCHVITIPFPPSEGSVKSVVTESNPAIFRFILASSTKILLMALSSDILSEASEFISDDESALL